MRRKFRPDLLSRNPHIQSMIATSPVRNIGPNAMMEASREKIIDGGNGIRLLGCHSCQQKKKSRGLVILIHGWEGSSHSAYIQSTGKYFFGKGYDVFRLNLRDHGESHHLNEGLFHGALIEETCEAVKNICGISSDLPAFLVGFSLGGNFALRIALRQSVSAIPNLKHVFSISPALDPYKSTLCIDKSLPFYRLYFLKKWKRSLRKKQALFPDKYDFNGVLNHRTCMGLTEAIMPWYPEFTDCRSYFGRYTLLKGAFRELDMPVTIIASEDDPFIPVDDFMRLEKNPNLHLLIQRYGGHCGFLEFFPYDCWYERLIDRIIAKNYHLTECDT
jgi:uncharacterized protein